MSHKNMTLDDLAENLETVIKKEDDGKAVKLDMTEVFNKVDELLYEDTDELIEYLLRIKMGISNTAYEFEKKFEMKEDSFRKWKAQVNSQLTRKDDGNPLKQKNRKTTNKAIKAELRSRDEYKQYKNRLTELKIYKNTLWTAKKVIEDLIDFVKIKMDNMYEV